MVPSETGNTHPLPSAPWLIAMPISQLESISSFNTVREKLICPLHRVSVKVTPGQHCLVEGGDSEIEPHPPIPPPGTALGVDECGAGYNYRTPAAPIARWVTVKSLCHEAHQSGLRKLGVCIWGTGNAKSCPSVCLSGPSVVC